MFAAPGAQARPHPHPDAGFDVLVFSKTAGFRHDSIPAGITAITQLGAADGFTVTATEDASAFTAANLARYEAVVFLSTTGDVLDDTQQNAFQAYVENGGGYVGVHAAADTEYDWPFYGALMGAWFQGHPAPQQATVVTEDHHHPATAGLDDRWTRTDEWYNYRTNPRADVHVLQSLDESSYSGGTMNGDHPITWCHPQGKGRSFYTGLGHTQESYSEAAFRSLLLGGIQYAAGAVAADCAPPTAQQPGTPSPDVHLFYYPWYGTPEVNGDWRHWQQGGHTPPEDIGADLYPKLGPYDSGDVDGAVAQHMKWVRESGAGVIVYSWWGRGSYEDTLARRVLDAAQAQGIKVAWHIEPYQGRTAASVADDIRYIDATYGGSPAFYRSADHGNRPAFYVFDSLQITDWSALDAVTGGNIVLAQTTDTSKISHFNGLYTYDGIAGATAPGWKNAGDYARQHGLVWSPSVAPGYLDDRAVPGNTTPTVGRDKGATYDLEWSNALDPAIGGSPTWVSVTSFNEWHEGSVIEPAAANPPAGHGYQTYDGAYGKTGAAAETAYLDRTAEWVAKFEATRQD
ncbi:ThuA domain-containing protein [Streptomyces sp. TS71-3]|uniref:ThuA domain-containing protein n=1 Tax=Streptomyces sp. TS71-3 TaxID=2733862 RepID=UPI0020180582|nr:ThuA domain-containing protein [Streptomyces sp. TS71-3]